MNDRTKDTSSIRFVAFAAVGLVLVLAAGATHGQLTQRWGQSDALARSVRIVESFPKQFGAWSQIQEGELAPVVREMLQCAAGLTREYEHQQTGDIVNVFVIAGPPGPTAVHTPEVCYPSRAVQQVGEKELVRLSEQGHADTFWRAEFGSRKSRGQNIIVNYAWSDDGVWKASNYPRVEYGGGRHLFKIQLATDASPRLSNNGQDEGFQADRAFLTDLLSSDWRPQLDETPR